MIKTIDCPDSPACSGRIQIDDARNGPAPCPKCGKRWYNRKGVMQSPSGAGGGTQMGDVTIGPVAGGDIVNVSQTGSGGPSDLRMRTTRHGGGFSMSFTTGENSREAKIRTLMSTLGVTREQADEMLKKNGQ